MNATISRLRERYKPERIKTLFIAESPPESEDAEVRFFYNPQQERWDHLYRSLMRAVFPDFEFRSRQKGKWLQKFKHSGYYLIDATDCPVNHLSRAERRKELLASVPGKLREVENLISRDTPIILVKKNIFEIYSDALRKSGYNVIHQSAMPFPSHGNQARFIEACRECLRRT